MTCLDSPGTAAWDDLVQLALHARPNTAPAWHAPGIKAAIRDVCAGPRNFRFADLAWAVVNTARNPESRTPVAITFDSAWSHVGVPPVAKRLSWDEGDPRYVCGICDLAEPGCRARSATNGHDFTPRTECMPATTVTPMKRSTCLGGHRDHPCPLPTGHEGDHEPPPPEMPTSPTPAPHTHPDTVRASEGAR